MKSWKTKSGYTVTRVLSGRSNVFLLSNGINHILIDTGIKMMGDVLLRRLKRQNITRLDALILTHSHFDHAGNAAWIKEKFNVPVIIHQSETQNLVSGEMVAIQGTNRFSRGVVYVLGTFFKHGFKCEPCPYDISIGEKFDLAPFGFQAFVMHTPGHTVGSVSVIVDDEIALVGDAMFGIFSGSVFPPFAQNPEVMVQSWAKLLEPGCSVFLPSHGSANHRNLVEKDYRKRKKAWPAKQE
ncbi:MAG: MBL fold metallo-hydrolase [Bacteroidia bacterium]|nr:MBL fold metallo-hydrolase [Bacteroidia bacterium]